MKRKLFSVFFALMLVLSLGLMAVPVAAAYDDYTDAITKTADRLVDLQGTDGGWDWKVTDLTTHSATYPSSFNLFGVTALGLIDAHEVTSKTAYFTAATKTADYLKGMRRVDMPPEAEWPVTEYYKKQTFDYRFLVEFSALSGDPSYEAHALSEWNWVKANVPDYYADGNQGAIYNWWYGVQTPNSHGYAFWQAADCGMATLAMGDTSYASAMATVLAGHLDDMAGDDECRFIGWGKALEFLNAVDPVAYNPEITGLITKLTTSQDDSGYWGLDSDGNPEGIAQDTAYAIMGLAVAGGAKALAAAEKGADWLVANQGYISTEGGLIEGGWNNSEGNIEYSETDSEALQAIKAVLDISGAVSMTATYIPLRPQIGISVTPLALDFGSLIPGEPSATKTVTVTNTGTVAEDFSASLTNISEPDVYTAGLQIGTGLVAVWGAGPVVVDASAGPEIILTVPTGTAPGTYTATLIFWAEAATQ